MDRPDRRLRCAHDQPVAGALRRRDRLDRLTALHDEEGRHVSLRRMLSDLVEEYGRHTDHADLLREAVDGLVGEDLPADWVP